MPACLRATVRIVSGIDDRSPVHTDVKLNKQTKILDFICSRNWKIKKRQVAPDPGPQTPWSCCSVSWLCFLQSWLHPQAESPWLAEMVLRVPSCPLTIAQEGKHLFPSGSAKNPGRELVRRAQIASLELAAGGRTGQSYLNSWESGQRVMIPEEKPSKQKTPLCSFSRKINLKILRSYRTGYAGLLSKTLLFSCVCLPRTRQQPNTLTVVIPICLLAQWH